MLVLGTQQVDGVKEVVLDGQHGEGGGQILRSGVSLAVAAGTRLRVEHIRARRQPPGLRPQHLQAVLALRDLCGGSVTGAQIGSSTLVFQPGPAGVACGNYRFDIGTAGSAPLLLHALCPALCTARHGTDQTESRVVLTGGTHLPMAPSAGYLTDVWSVAAQRCGLPILVEMRRPGFYPRGGGELHALIGADRPKKGLCWLERQGKVEVRARAGVARAPAHIARRMLMRVGDRLREAGVPFDPALHGTTIDHGNDSLSSGVYLELVLDAAPVPAGFTALGERGVSAETVADRAVDALLQHLQTGAAVDPHLADQLAIFLCLCTDPAGSRYRTSAVTQHLLTHAEVVTALWPVRVTVTGELGQPGEVEIVPTYSTPPSNSPSM